MNDMTDYVSPTERVKVWCEESALHVRFNNPAKHNALSVDMWEAVPAILARAAEDDAVRVVVLSGEGEKAFVSGADISQFEDLRAAKEAVRKYEGVAEAALQGIHDFAKPTVACIRGYCIGGGVGLASCCDMRICSDNSKFAVPAAKLGLGYAYAGLKRLVDIVGASFAKEIFYTARQFDAQEAYAMGLVNRVVPQAELEAYVNSITDMICTNAPLTIKAAKFAIGEILKDESKRDMARVDAMVEACFASTDYVEGRTAFMAKRKPEFTGK